MMREVYVPDWSEVVVWGSLVLLQHKACRSCRNYGVSVVTVHRYRLFGIDGKKRQLYDSDIGYSR